MLKEQRANDHNFCGWQQLYRRCVDEDVLGDRLLPSRIPYNNTSVNWSKYSKPWDVIFDYPGCGITCLQVRALPKELPKEQPVGNIATLHSFVAEHDPEEDNYSHTQIVTYKEGTKLTGRINIPSVIKKELRTIISDRSVILLYPKP